MQYLDYSDPAAIAERERMAYANGDTVRADSLRQLADQADELQRLRALYWTLCDLYPIESKAKKQEFIDQAVATWDALQKAGDIGDA